MCVYVRFAVASAWVDPRFDLRSSNSRRLDLKTPGAASEADSSLEAVGTVHRPNDSSR